MSPPLRDSEQRFLLGRVLGLERHEYYAVAWSFVYFFCVLSAYYMLRSVRETMAVEGGVLRGGQKQQRWREDKACPLAGVLARVAPLLERRELPPAPPLFSFYLSNNLRQTTNPPNHQKLP